MLVEGVPFYSVKLQFHSKTKEKQDVLPEAYQFLLEEHK